MESRANQNRIMGWFLVLLGLILPMTQADDTSMHVQRSDDVSLSSLDVVVQQQAAMIQSLQAELGAMKSRMAVLESDSSILKTKVTALSTDVAFTVRFKADNAVQGVAIAANSALRFDNIVLNVGNGYDAQTGIFTAPVAGTYSFFLTQMGAGSHGATELSIQLHGKMLDVVYSKDHEDQGSSQVTTRLKAGELVWIEPVYGSAVRGGWYTVFSGYLIQAN